MLFFIPTGYDALTGEYTGYGQFCSPQCVKAYLIYTPSGIIPHESSMRLMLLSQFVLRELKSSDIVIPAPPKCMRVEYGGHMTREEYRTRTSTTYYINHKPVGDSIELVRGAVISSNPDVNQSEVSEHVATGPEPVEPVALKPVTLKPVASKPVASTPVALKPVASSPQVVEPKVGSTTSTTPTASATSTTTPKPKYRPRKPKVPTATLSAFLVTRSKK